MKITALVVRAGVVSFEQVGNDLKSMQQVIGGGYLEHVSLRGVWDGLHMWLDEEGWLKRLVPRQTPFYPALIAGDYFVTRLDEEGDATSLEPGDIACLKVELGIALDQVAEKARTP